MIYKSFILKLWYWHCTAIVEIKNKIGFSLKTLVSKWATTWSYKESNNRGAAVITTSQLHLTLVTRHMSQVTCDYDLTKPELRFSASSNPARRVSEIRDGEGTMTMVPAGNKAKRLSSVYHTTKTILYHSSSWRLKRIHSNLKSHFDMGVLLFSPFLLHIFWIVFPKNTSEGLLLSYHME